MSLPKTKIYNSSTGAFDDKTQIEIYIDFIIANVDNLAILNGIGKFIDTK